MNALIIHGNRVGIDIVSIIENIVAESKMYNIVSIANSIRYEASIDSNNWNKMKIYLDKGLLIPNRLIEDLIMDKIAKYQSSSIIHILSDYPKSKDQLKSLHTKIEILKKPVYLSISDESVRRFYLKKWHADEYSYLKKYNKSLYELNSFISNQIEHKNRIEKYYSVIDEFVVIDLSEKTDDFIKDKILEVLYN